MSRELPADPTMPLGLTAHPGDTIRGPDTPGLALAPARTRLNGAYTCFDTLGTGGTAIVRRAHQASLDREVAIKTPLHGASSPTTVWRVLQEAWVTGALQHPGVVPVHDVVMDGEGCPHIVMRRIEGWTWTELINRPDEVERAFGVRDVLAWHLRVLMAVAGTVHHAHGRGVLHRDLKPDNVMIGPGGEAYVLDWGIAVALDQRAAHRLPLAADQLTLAGTPHYMAPEMARGDGPAISVASDVYLLGGLLYAILTGSPPHPGDDPQVVIAGAAADVPILPPSAPMRLAQLCTQTLALDPAERPPSAESLRRQVQSYLEERHADALVEAGQAALTDLVSRSADAAAHDVPALFAACRLAFEQAIAHAPDHADAHSGLAAARTARIRWDLNRGDARAAFELLEEMTEPPSALVDEVRAALALHASRTALADQLIADHDEAAGIRTRTFVSLLLGLALTFLPLAAHFFSPDPSLLSIAAATTSMLGLMLGLWFWARDSLSRSMLNRAVIRTAVVTPVMNLLLVLGAQRMGLTASQVMILCPFIAAIIAVCFMILLDPWMAVAAVGYSAAFLLGGLFPDLCLVWLSASNAALLSVALWRWGPTALKSWIKFRRDGSKRSRRL